MSLDLPFSIILSNVYMTKEATWTPYEDRVTPGGGTTKVPGTPTTIRIFVEELDDYSKTYWSQRFGHVDVSFYTTAAVNREDVITYDGNDYDVMHVEILGSGVRRLICRRR